MDSKRRLNRLRVFTVMLSGIALCNSLLLSGATAETMRAQLNVTDLRCEYLREPLAVETTAPRLSWKIETGNVGQEPRGITQTAYQLLVASSEALLKHDKGDLWDSGKVASAQTSQIVYGGSGTGKPLLTHMRCFWKVRVWDGHGNMTAWSKPSVWTMGMLRGGLACEMGASASASACQRKRALDLVSGRRRSCQCGRSSV